MKTLRQLIASKDKKLAFVGPDQTVLHALEVMAENNVGAVVVLDNELLVGIFSERDYARKIILRDKSSKNTFVREIMTSKVICVTPDKTIEECMEIMTEEHFRHLPVLDEDKKLIGIISIGDVVKEMISHQKFIISQLENYITS